MQLLSSEVYVFFMFSQKKLPFKSIYDNIIYIKIILINFTMLLYAILWILSLLIIFNIFLFVFWYKINHLESKIMFLFEKRLWIIPSLYEISKEHIVRHSNEFNDVMMLYKIEATIHDKDIDFADRIHTQSLIHHELDFIYKIINKHNKLLHDHKFVYLRDITMDNSFKISKLLSIYKNILKSFNSLVKINNLFLIWKILPIEYKKEI